MRPRSLLLCVCLMSTGPPVDVLAWAPLALGGPFIRPHQTSSSCTWSRTIRVAQRVTPLSAQLRILIADKMDKAVETGLTEMGHSIEMLPDLQGEALTNALGQSRSCPDSQIVCCGFALSAGV